MSMQLASLRGFKEANGDPYVTDYEILPRPEGGPARDQLGEGPFWSEAEAALYWVDIAGRWAHRLEPASGVGKSWRMPSSCSAFIPTVRGDHLVALVDGVHRLDLATGRT